MQRERERERELERRPSNSHTSAYPLDSLIFLSGTAVFSTEQQPGAVLVALMGERGELLCTKGSERALKATFGCLKPRGHVVRERTEVGDS